MDYPGSMRSTNDDNLFEALLVIGKILGMSRSVATVFAVLYSRDTPCTAEEISREANLSKSAVSLALRELFQFGAVQEASVPGARSRHYCGQPDLAETATLMMMNRIQNPLGVLRSRLDESESSHVRLEQARNLLNTIDHVLASIQPTGNY